MEKPWAPTADVPDQPDPVTGLLGRRAFERDLQQHIEELGPPLAGSAVLVIGLDHYSRIFSHSGGSLDRADGDPVLAQVSDRLRASIRSLDRVAHLEADTFAVLLAGVHHLDEAASMARKIAAALGRPIEVSDEFVMLTASVGGALSGTEGPDARALMAAAENALARARQRGTRQVEISAASPPSTAAITSAGAQQVKRPGFLREPGR